MSALATIALVKFIGFGHAIFFSGAFGEEIAQLSGWQILLVPTLGGAVVGAVLYWWSPGHRYHGVSDVMEAAAVRGSAMDFRNGWVSSVATVMSLSSGASLGREGPAIHLCATLSASICKLLRLDRSDALILLGCGAAGAVTASFNAPIAGVLFALEVIVGYYSLRVLTPTVISAIGAVIVARYVLGDSPAFQLPRIYKIESLWELPAFALLGVAAALAALALIYVVKGTKSFWQKVRCPVWMQPALGGLLIGVIALQFPLVLGVGYEATDMALREALPILLLFALLLAKVVATGVCLGSGFAGGVFSPGLFIGAMLGGVVWWIASSVMPSMASSQGVYSIVGMAGVASALLGAPISTLLIIFELTADFHLVIAVMLAAAVASTMMQCSPHKSFFRWQLEQRGINLNLGRNQNLLLVNTVASSVSQSFSRINLAATLGEARRQLVRDRVSVLLVVDDNDYLLGSVSLNQLLSSEVDADPDTSFEEYLADADCAVTSDTSLNGALELLDQHQVECVPVVEAGDDGAKVLGVVYRSDLLHAYNDALRRARDEEYGVN